MTKSIKIKINGQEIIAEEGQTILEAAQKNGIEIPTLCHHSDLKASSSCRVCVVEVKSSASVGELKTACSATVREGMEITTDSPEIRRARQVNLELIFAQHVEECDDCIWRFHCQLLDLAKKYQVKIARFPDRKKQCPVYEFDSSYIFDSTKCIDCRNCVEACAKQSINFWEVEDRGYGIKIVPTKDEKKECVYCGQCAVHCPAGAMEAVGEFEDIEKPLLEKDKIVVVQIAPSIRVSIGEEFNLPYGEVLTEKLAAALRKIGFNKVFDTSLGSDFTTIEEAKELTERIAKGHNLPMLTSCCPGWVRFVEFYYPEFIPYLTSVRSPHILLGGLIKTYWAEKEKIDPKKITVVSIMPCLAKKYEITRPELEVDGLYPVKFAEQSFNRVKPVDYVLTTRELAYLIAKNKIDLKTIEPAKLDNPLGMASGAGVIFGASGGVMESALRTVCKDLTGEDLPKVELEAVRGTSGLRKAAIKINGRTLKVATISGLGNAREILEELKKNPAAYDYIEVMACPGGCIGGGGQPVPTNEEIRRKRAASLYQIDAGKEGTKETRMAHQNPVVKEIYRDYLNEEDKIRRICHTRYSPANKKPYEIVHHH